jgi:DNA-binding response OmpR family regulator
MTANGTLLCINRDPSQLTLLEQNGYQLVTATNGHDGLRLFMSRPVDAIVLDYHLELLDGGVVADEIKKVEPKVPIVMLAQDLELPVVALKVVDALVVKSDGPDLLLATIRSLLDGKTAPFKGDHPERQIPTYRRGPSTSWDGKERRKSILGEFAADQKDAALSPELWKSIRNGTVRF